MERILDPFGFVGERERSEDRSEEDLLVFNPRQAPKLLTDPSRPWRLQYPDGEDVKYSAEVNGRALRLRIDRQMQLPPGWYALRTSAKDAPITGQLPVGSDLTVRLSASFTGGSQEVLAFSCTIPKDLTLYKSSPVIPVLVAEGARATLGVIGRGKEFSPGTELYPLILGDLELVIRLDEDPVS